MLLRVLAKVSLFTVASVTLLFLVLLSSFLFVSLSYRAEYSDAIRGREYVVLRVGIREVGASKPPILENNYVPVSRVTLVHPPANIIPGFSVLELARASWEEFPLCGFDVDSSSIYYAGELVEPLSLYSSVVIQGVAGGGYLSEGLLVVAAYGDDDLASECSAGCPVYSVYSDDVNLRGTREVRVGTVMVSQGYGAVGLAAPFIGGPTIVLAGKVAERIPEDADTSGVLLIVTSPIEREALASCVSRLEEKFNVDLEALVIKGEDLVDELVYQRVVEVPAGAYLVVALPLIPVLAWLARHETMGERAASAILVSRGSSGVRAYTASALAYLLSFSLSLIVYYAGLASTTLVVAVGFYLVLSIVLLLASRLGWRLPWKASRILNMALLPVSGVIVVAVLAGGLASGVGGLAFKAVASLLDLANAERLPTIVGLSFYTAFSRLLLVVLVAYVVYRILLAVSDRRSRSIATPIARLFFAHVLAATLVLSFAATGPIALIAGLEATLGSNIVIRGQVPQAVVEELESLEGVRAVGSIYSLGSALILVGPIGLSVNVRCYGGDLLEFLEFTSGYSVTSSEALAVLRESRGLIDPGLARELEAYDRLGEGGLIRVKGYTIDLSSLTKAPPALRGLVGGGILVECPEGFEGVATALTIYMVADASVAGALSADPRLHGSMVGDALSEGVRYVEDSIFSSMALVSVPVAVLALAFSGLQLLREASSRYLGALRVLLSSRGYTGALKVIRDSWPLLPPLALVLAQMAYLAYILVLPIRLGYSVLGETWYLLGLASTIIVAASIPGLYIAFARVVGGDES